MKRRRNSPALYELINVRSPARAPAPEVEHHVEIQDVGDAPARRSNWLSPGQTLRLPVGYVFLAAALTIVLLIVMYVFGYQSAANRYEAEIAAIRADQITADGIGRDVVDPLTQREGGPGGPGAREPGRSAAQPGAGRSSSPSTGTGGTSNRGRASSDASGWGPIESDPRADGLNYLRLITTTRENAVEVAQFCRDNGLEAYVVGRDNARLVPVIVLPGFAGGTLNSPEAQALKSKVETVGIRWEQTGRGNTNFQGAIWERYG